MTGMKEHATNKGTPLRTPFTASAAHSLQETRRWIAALRRMNDPALGNIGKDLCAAFRQAACPVFIDPEMKLLAVHTSFTYTGKTARSVYENTIYLSTRATAHGTRHFSALVHEMTHATQTAHSAILHASPYNTATDIVLCPRDFITACERAEQDAYARQALFASLMLRARPDQKRSASNKDPVPVRIFETLRRRAPAPLDALRQATQYMLARPGYYSAQGHSVPLADSYHELALTAYAGIMESRLKEPDLRLRFIRMEDEDILDIGRSYGPSLFGDGEKLLPEFAQRPDLSPHNRALLAQLNARLGITDENDLPSFGAALAAQQMTRAEFLARSKRNTPSKPAAGPC